MRNKEFAAILALLYDYKLRSMNNYEWIRPINDYLIRKGYLYGKNSLFPMMLTRKSYKILHKYKIIISLFEEFQEQFNEKGYVTYYDKKGKKYKI